MRMLHSSANLPQCSTEAEISEFADLTKASRYMSEEALFQETGCLSPCHKVILGFKNFSHITLT